MFKTLDERFILLSHVHDNDIIDIDTLIQKIRNTVVEVFHLLFHIAEFIDLIRNTLHFKWNNYPIDDASVKFTQLSITVNDRLYRLQEIMEQESVLIILSDMQQVMEEHQDPLIQFRLAIMFILQRIKTA